MPRKRSISLRCPTCKKLVLRGDAEFPFCSERCRLVDLGKWASGAHVISTPITDPEAFESQTQSEDRNRRQIPDSRDEHSRYRN